VVLDDNPDPNALAPQMIVLRLKDGRIFQRHIVTPWGSPGNELSRDDQLAKANFCFELGGLDQPADALFEAASRLDRMDNAADFFHSVAPQDSPPMPLSRAQMITSVIDTYFEMLNAHDLDGVMRGMTKGCEMRIPSSNFTYTGAEAIRIHLAEFLETFETVNFHNYVVCADPQTGGVGLYFDVFLTAHDGEQINMHNANFFKLDDAGLITDILIFASAPLSRGFEAGSST
jgi:hypothetical protein